MTSRLKLIDLNSRSEPERLPPPLGHRVAAFDLGERRIGVVITDADGGFVTYRETILRHSVLDDRRAIGRILEEYQVEILVIGLPLNSDGSEGFQASRCRRWATQLFEDRIEDFVWENEYLTSDVARRMGAVGKEVDVGAAGLLLQSFLRKPRR